MLTEPRLTSVLSWDDGKIIYYFFENLSVNAISWKDSFFIGSVDLYKNYILSFNDFKFDDLDLTWSKGNSASNLVGLIAILFLG